MLTKSLSLTGDQEEVRLFTESYHLKKKPSQVESQPSNRQAGQAAAIHPDGETGKQDDIIMWPVLSLDRYDVGTEHYLQSGLRKIQVSMTWMFLVFTVPKYL